MKTQIPIYRAKTIDSDEWVEESLIEYPYGNGFFMLITFEYRNNTFKDEFSWKIDPSTLAIHFQGMTDSKGTKIFASLSEDGKGGDICNYIFFYGDNHHRKYNDTAKFTGLYGLAPYHLQEIKRKVIVAGIQND